MSAEARSDEMCLRSRMSFSLFSFPTCRLRDSIFLDPAWCCPEPKYRRKSQLSDEPAKATLVMKTLKNTTNTLFDLFIAPTEKQPRAGRRWLSVLTAVRTKIDQIAICMNARIDDHHSTCQNGNSAIGQIHIVLAPEPARPPVRPKQTNKLTLPLVVATMIGRADRWTHLEFERVESVNLCLESIPVFLVAAPFHLRLVDFFLRPTKKVLRATIDLRHCRCTRSLRRGGTENELHSLRIYVLHTLYV